MTSTQRSVLERWRQRADRRDRSRPFGWEAHGHVCEQTAAKGFLREHVASGGRTGGTYYDELEHAARIFAPVAEIIERTYRRDNRPPSKGEVLDHLRAVHDAEYEAAVAENELREAVRS